MIRRIFKKKRIRNTNSFVEPDEIFLDSKNIQNFNRQQFEGRIEKAIPKKTILFLGIFFIISGILFSTRLWYLQIEKGESYFSAKKNIRNYLDRHILVKEYTISFKLPPKFAVSVLLEKPKFTIATAKYIKGK